MESSENIRCKECSTLGEKSDRFCNNCGHEIEHIKSTKITCLGTIKDKQCNNILTYDARFCQDCGTKNPQYVSEEKPLTKDDYCKKNSQQKDVEEQSVAISLAIKENPLAKGDNCKESLQGKDVKEQPVTIFSAKREQSFTEVDCFKETSQRKDVQEQPVTFSESKEENPLAKGDYCKESLQGKDVKEQPVTISSAKKEQSFTEVDCFKETSQRKDVQEQPVTFSESNGQEATSVSGATISTENNERSSDFEVGEELDLDIIEEISDLSTFKDEILRHIRLGDLVSYAKTLSDQANLMKKVKVKVAVAGESFTGKSTFINAIRGVKPDEEGFAKVGFGNTTTTVNKYRHPKNKRIVFYDLPGYNTTQITVKDFLKKISLSTFDLFLIFFTAVLTEADIWIVEQLRLAGVKFCFIRAKIDDDLENAREIGQQDDAALSTITDKITESMKTFKDLIRIKIFYISSKYPSIGEMNKIITFMEEEVAPAKFEAVLFSIPSFTKEVIQKKNKTLKRRVVFLALRFAVLHRLFAYWKIKEEIEMFYRVFQLDQDLAKHVKNVKHRYTAERICTHFEDFKSQGLHLASVNQRYRFCKNFMTDLLNVLTEDANAIYQYILDKEN